jgi:hypothetical protein
MFQKPEQTALHILIVNIYVSKKEIIYIYKKEAGIFSGPKNVSLFNLE